MRKRISITCSRLGLACLALLASAASAQAGTPAVRSTPALEPPFQPGTPDYATRCAGTHRLRIGSRTFKLAPGQAARFKVKGRSYHVRCLPQDFPRFSATRHGKPQAEFYVVTPNYPLPGRLVRSRYAAVFDNHGAPLWWTGHDDGREIDDAKLLPNGHIAWSNNLIGYYGASTSNRFEEHRLDGSLVRTYATQGSPTDFHELEPVPGPGERRMLLTYRERDGEDMTSCGGDNAPSSFPVTDGEIQEVDASGRVTWSWNTHTDGGISVDETGRYCQYTWPFAQASGAPADDVHANGIEAFTQNGREKVLFSGARLDAIYQIDKQTKRIDWKLGGTKTDESLTVIGDDEYGPWHLGGQHDVRRYRDGTITVHDNQTFDARPPRAVRFRIDEAARTATRVESLTDPAATLSFCCGSARKLAKGNWVMEWGFLPFVTEMTPRGKRVFRLDFGGVYSYRADPIEPGRLTRAALRRGMDRMRR